MARRTRMPVVQTDLTADLAAIVDRLLEEFQTLAASILAVDDSASMRQVVSYTPKVADYDVIESADGRHGPVDRR